MSSKEWIKYKLGDVLEVAQGLAINAKSKHLLQDTGLPLLRITDLINNTQIQFVNTEGVPKQSFANYNDLIYTRTGQVGLVFKGKIGVIHNNCFKVIPNKKIIDSIYLYYFLFQTSTKELANAIASGSVQKDLPHSAFKSIEIDIPFLETQYRIASILSSLDDKIELNRQTNQTLEGIAQTLFQEMCVVKGEELPEGWRVGKLGEVCKNIRKTANPKDFGTNMPYVGLEHIPRKSLCLNNYGISSDVSSQKSLFNKYDILFGKLRPYFHKVCIAPIKGICSTDILVIEPLKKEWFSFCMNHLYSDELIKYVSSIADGTRMPRVDWKSMSDYEILIPPKESIEKLNEICLPLYKNMLSNNKENQTLIALRDSLLPKLMKGEIEI